MSRVARCAAVASIVALCAGCGDLLFSSNPSATGVSTLSITGLSIEWRLFPDTLVRGDSSVAEVRIKNQGGEDVTPLVDQVSWSVSPINVAVLSQGATLGNAKRMVRAVSQGQATVQVGASFTRPNGDHLSVQPASRPVIVKP